MSYDPNDPNNMIFNFSSYELSDVAKSLLCKGLNFSVKPKLIEYSEFLVPFELLSHSLQIYQLHNFFPRRMLLWLHNFLMNLSPFVIKTFFSFGQLEIPRIGIIAEKFSKIWISLSPLSMHGNKLATHSLYAS